MKLTDENLRLINHNDDGIVLRVEGAETFKEYVGIKRQILKNQKRSEWLDIIEDLIDEKITDNHSIAKLFMDVRRHKTKAEKYDKLITFVKAMRDKE